MIPIYFVVQHVALFAFTLAAKVSVVITDKAEEATITSGYIRDMTIPLP